MLRDLRSPFLMSLLILVPAIADSVGRPADPGTPATRLLSQPGVCVDPLRYDRAREQWRQLPRANMFSAMSAGSIPGTVWKPIGPDPIVENGCCVSPTLTFAANGRVNSIAVDPTNSNVLYLGSAGGGVWKSVDRGAHWTPTTDQEISLGIGVAHALAVDPNHPNTIYAGTSSFALLDQSLPRTRDEAQSRGILKSTDGGASWIRLGVGVPTGNVGNADELFKDININTIIVDPANSSVLYLAAGRGGDPNPGGAFRSTDAGLNWTLATDTTGMRVESLALDTSSQVASRVLYAGAWEQGVLKSTDGAQSWTPVLTAATPSVMAYTPFHKVMVALAPPASPPLAAGPVVYASLMQNNFSTAVIFENANGGAAANWVKKNAQILTFSNTDFAQLNGGGFSDMVVDPSSPGDGANDLLYWGGFTQYLSTDSGNTFNEIGQVHGIHGDHQTWLIVPHTGTNTVYAGDDGGIWRSEDQGATWTGNSLTSLASTINAGGLQIATLYQLAVKQDATAAITIGGAQDSGLLRTTGGASWSGTSNDGIDVVFDKVNTDTVYAIANSSFLKATDSGASWPWPVDFSANLPALQIGIFQNRLAVDPNNAGFLYVGGSGRFPNPPATPTPGDVLQSRDGTSSFRSLGLAAPWYISSLDVSRLDSNRVVVSSQSRVFVTTNALAATVGPPSGVVFQNITGNLPGHFVTRVAFDPNDANVVYATLSGFGGGHVFRKAITDVNWTDISPSVDLPVNAIALDGGVNPAILYIGTDLGVLRRSVAGGGVWEVVDDLHLPNAAVSDLEINVQAGVLRAATWGRGVFELAAPSGPAISVLETSLEFGETCATGTDLSIHVSSVGSVNLVVSSVQRLSGSANFTVLPSPTTPLVIAPGSTAIFTVHYTPTLAGVSDSAIIRVSSNDPAVPFVDLVASGSLETSPPTITCPSNITVVSAVACPPTASTVITFPAPAASDNCPGVTTACNPPSGSNFPVGTSTVTCTATDTAGNTATCTFSVTVFNGRLQDDSNSRNVLLYNTQTGDYSLCCGGVVYTGKGTVTLRGCIFTLQHNPPDRRLLVNVDFSLKKGTASFQSPPGSTQCTITDRNIADDTSKCP